MKTTSYPGRTARIAGCALSIGFGACFSVGLRAQLPATAGAAAPRPSASSASASAGAWQVAITDLGLLPGGIYASAYALNDSGKIVGMAYDASGALKTVQWLNGQISILPALSPSAACVPEDVNDAGEIVGNQHVFSGGIYYGVYWDSANQPSALAALPGGLSNLVRAHGINASGQIAGMGQQGAPNYWGHAALWLGSSFQNDLGFLAGGHFSEAYGINDFGLVVGSAQVASGANHAFAWFGGQYTDLSSWSGGGASSTAHAVNNHGEIVGLNASVASLWKNGSVQALPMPAGVSAFTPALDINDAGDIIATASKGYPIDVGVLWRNGEPIELGTLPGGTISRARRINQAGEIVGEANAANGFFHAVKWTVTPSAGAWTNLGHALAGGNGLPFLAGSGALTTGSSIAWSLSNAKRNAPVWFVVGLSQLQLPIAGGLLVPSPDFLLPAATSALGTASLAPALAQALPAGQQLSVQAWLLDPAGAFGWAASNAIAATAP